MVLGWAGLAAMVSCGLLLTVDRSFPGFIALWPTLAAAAIIAGRTERQPLRRRPVPRLPAAGGPGGQFLALYLWHWPLLVLALAAAGLDAPNLVQGLAVVGRLLVLAVLTTRFVEKPLHRLALAPAAGPAHRRRHCWPAGAVLAGPVRGMADHAHRRGKRRRRRSPGSCTPVPPH